MNDGYMDAAAVPVPAAGDDTLRERLIDALVMSPLSDTAGTDLAPFRRTADALLPLIRDHVERGIEQGIIQARADERRVLLGPLAEYDVHTEYAVRFADGSIGVEQDTLEGAKAYARHRAKQNRTLVGTPLEDPSGPVAGYVKRHTRHIYPEWEAVEDA